MDETNPVLYQKFVNYIKDGREGIEIFRKAMQVQSHNKPEPLGLNSFRRSSVKPLTLNDNQNDRISPNGTFNFESPLSPAESVFEVDVNNMPLAPVRGFFRDIFTLSSHTDSSEGVGYSLLKYPFLVFVGLMIMVELFFYAMVRQYVALWEYFFVWTGKLRNLQHKLRESPNYESWKKVGLELDTHMGKDSWRENPVMAYYDHQLICDLNSKMGRYRKQNRIEKVKDLLLHGGLKSNVGNIENAKLYSNTYYGTKQVVEDFYEEAVKCLDYIGESDKLTNEEKKTFFEEAFQSYGRSALCLSGGASMAYFHFGVVQALLESSLLPKIITGTSAGSLIAAMVGTRTDEELREILKPDTHVLIRPCSEPFSVKFMRLLRTGALFDAANFASNCQWATLGHTTFLEAYQRTGKILNVTAVPYDSYSPAKLFNYLSAPDMVIWSAVIASSAVPGVLTPITLMIKTKEGILEPYISSGAKWRDGSLKTDIPLDALNSFFNVNYSLVSQVNPHVTIFYYNHRGTVGRPAAHRYGKGWRGGFLASSVEHFLKLDLKKWLRVLRDLELLPTFMQQDWSYVWLQKFDGSVTIMPKVNLLDYFNILRDPDYDGLSKHLRNGALKTWPVLHMLDNRAKIEKRIFYWLHKLFEPNNTPLSDEPDIPDMASIGPNGQTSNQTNNNDVNGETNSAQTNFDLPVIYKTPSDILNHIIDPYNDGDQISDSSS